MRSRRRWIAVLVVALLCWCVRAYGWQIRPKPELSGDFAAIITAPLMWENGTISELYAWGNGTISRVTAPERLAATRAFGLSGNPPPFVYPPIASFLLFGWHRFDYIDALRAWRLLSLVAFWVGTWLWWISASPLPESSNPTRSHVMLRRWAIILSVSMFSVPLSRGIMFGQTTNLVFFTSALAIYLARRRHPALAGASLAFASCIKLTPALLVVVWLSERNRRAILSFIAACTILAALSFTVFGSSLHREFYWGIQKIHEGTILLFNNASIDGWIGRCFLPSIDIKSGYPVALNPLATALIFAIKCILAVALGWVVVRSARKQAVAKPSDSPQPKPCRVEANAIALAILLLPAVSWMHYFIWIFPVSVSTYSSLATHPMRRALRLACVVAVALVCWPVMPPRAGPEQDLSVYSISSGPISALILVVVLCFAHGRTLDRS